MAEVESCRSTTALAQYPALFKNEATLLIRQEGVLRLLEQLLERVRKAEEDLSRVPRDDQPISRVKQAAHSLPLPSAVFRRVPSTYYQWPLTQRQRCLGAPSVHQLCKTILLENTHCTRTDCSEPRNSRYYAIIIQYTTKLQSHKVHRFVRKLNPELSKKKFKFTLAQEEVSNQLTGFGKGSICPVGMDVSVPVILSDQILRLDPPFMWLGGGHTLTTLSSPVLSIKTDVKMGCNVREFIKVTSCYVAGVVHDGEGEEEEASAYGNG